GAGSVEGLMLGRSLCPGRPLVPFPAPSFPAGCDFLSSFLAHLCVTLRDALFAVIGSGQLRRSVSERIRLEDKQLIPGVGCPFKERNFDHPYVDIEVDLVEFACGADTYGQSFPVALMLSATLFQVH